MDVCCLLHSGLQASVRFITQSLPGSTKTFFCSTTRPAASFLSTLVPTSNENGRLPLTGRCSLFREAPRRDPHLCPASALLIPELRTIGFQSCYELPAR